jgi:hypothetical protein
VASSPPELPTEMNVRANSKIASTYYEYQGQRLTVTFDSGREVMFYDVPAKLAELIASSNDRLDYLEVFVIGHYPWIERNVRARLRQVG